ARGPARPRAHVAPRRLHAQRRLDVDAVTRRGRRAGTGARDGIQPQRLHRGALGSTAAELGGRDLPPPRTRRAGGAHAALSRVVQPAPPAAAMTRHRRCTRAAPPPRSSREPSSPGEARATLTWAQNRAY